MNFGTNNYLRLARYLIAFWGTFIKFYVRDPD
jgi:hypothetical protein